MINKSDILLSVCITTFNMEEYIEHALESVLMQETDFAFEIIVTDDCSMDKTIEILEKYKKEYSDKLVLLFSDENKGIIANCTKALKEAKGKYIALLDADDYWIDKHKLQKQVNILESDTEAGFVYTNFMYVDESGRIGTKGISEDFTPPKKGNFETYLLNPYISPSTICFRQAILNFERLHVFIEKKFASQEYAIFLDFTKNEKGIYLKDYTMCYTVRMGSHSRQQALEKQIQNFYNSFETGNWFIQQNPIPAILSAKRDFNFKLKVLLASWASNNFDYVKQFTKELQAKDFLQYNPKALYIYIASKNKWLYKLFKSWVLRKRKPGR